MKTWFTYAICVGFMGMINAQASNSVIEEKLPYYPNEINFTTEILGLGEDFILDHWQQYILEHGGKSEILGYEKGDLQMVSREVRLPPLDNEIVTLNAMLSPNASETGVNLSINVQKKDGTYLSDQGQDKVAAKKLEAWLLDFNRGLTSLEKQEVFSHYQVKENNHKNNER
ncbi:MAG: hypothetical protein VXW38_16385 [Bacteroidota bacterium]|nr:hypothetical protein [Bacteroidota bacterium]